jgi:catechol 2,3-dioxygenase-like lactoylglutathione lyase family enzyme
MRLRHIALVTGDLDAVAARLARELGLGAPFVEDQMAPDWGVANAVFALGDQFLEVMAPTRPGTAVGRHLARRGGDAGYMVMFQVDDVGVARARTTAAGARIVWSYDSPTMSGTHLDPRDVPGAIVALDQATPPESWAWGGPDWPATAAAGALLGVTVAVADPGAVAARWAAVLGATPPDVTFVTGDGGLVGAHVRVPDAVHAGRAHADVGGVRFRFAL